MVSETKLFRQLDTLLQNKWVHFPYLNAAVTDICAIINHPEVCAYRYVDSPDTIINGAPPVSCAIFYYTVPPSHQREEKNSDEFQQISLFQMSFNMCGFDKSEYLGSEMSIIHVFANEKKEILPKTKQQWPVEIKMSMGQSHLVLVNPKKLTYNEDILSELQREIKELNKTSHTPELYRDVFFDQKGRLVDIWNNKQR